MRYVEDLGPVAKEEILHRFTSKGPVLALHPLGRLNLLSIENGDKSFPSLCRTAPFCKQFSY